MTARRTSCSAARDRLGRQAAVSLAGHGLAGASPRSRARSPPLGLIDAAARLDPSGRVVGLELDGPRRRHLFVGVRQVPAGSRFVITADGRSQAGNLLDAACGGPARRRTSGRPVDRHQLRDLVSDAVRLRQRSDVPIGFTLSGGIDSTMLICEAARLNGQGSLLAFAYQDEAYNEEQQVSDTVAQTGAELISISERDLDLTAILPALIRANGEPVHSMSAVANYALFGLARQAQRQGGDRWPRLRRGVRGLLQLRREPLVRAVEDRRQVKALWSATSCRHPACDSQRSATACARCACKRARSTRHLPTRGCTVGRARSVPRQAAAKRRGATSSALIC